MVTCTTGATGAETSLPALVEQCLLRERELGLAPRSLRSCGQYLRQFVEYCAAEGIARGSDLTAALITGYIAARGASGGPPPVKSLVWSVRKLCSFLCLRSILSENPARDLRHPPISVRSELPRYLSAAQLR